MSVVESFRHEVEEPRGYRIHDLPTAPAEHRLVGRDAPRADAAAKVTGRAVYGTDIARAGMLHAKVLRSPHAHARIVSIDASAARRLAGVHAVFTRDEATGLQSFGTMVKDQPPIAIDRVRYVGDIVAAVAAADERTALAALDLIDVRYEILPPVFGIENALADDAPEIFPDAPFGGLPLYGTGASATLRAAKNVPYEFRYSTGDPAVWDECDRIFEDTFHYSRMNHMHLEPFVTVAEATDEEIEIWTSTQAPFNLRKELSRVFCLPENRIRVHVPLLGGGFGAKNGPKADPVAIRLSQLAGGRPVRFAMTTEEVFLTVSQHAATIVVKSGVKNDGTFVARQSTVLLDGGAYSEHSPAVAEKAGYRMPGAYRWRHIDSMCRVVTTNTVPAGAMRGFGGTQATWASERQVDLIAQRLGMSPYDLRIANLKALGEEFVPGESGIDSDLAEGMRVVADAIGYHEPREANTGTVRRGRGVAVGVKDGGGIYKPAMARVKVTSKGDVLLSCALTEMGQGGHSALCQIVAEVLSCPPERVRYSPIDTDNTPFDQGTNASSGVAVTGQAVRSAAENLRRTVLAWAGEQFGFDADSARLDDWTVRSADGDEHPLFPRIMAVFGNTGFEFSADGFYKARNDHNAPLEAPCVFWEIGWAAAEVEVDTETGKVTVLQLAVSGDAGKVINKIACRGQDEGAAVFGLAQAMFEEMRYDESGELLNAEALLYRVPLAEDIPEKFVSITQEQGHGAGPFGAKGMGEGGMLPVAPAIAQAVADATGAQITSLPMTPERVFTALEQSSRGLE
ncbi:xanthine dehydrogenase family protein molybdopterin-binding subunit [Rhodococcus rhodnii]|uniref:Bifunctional xanthine dehydrogenase n=2 Tax=Rhodococcus rhodnii TaxID=38312 RepID=R7WHC1_9NOCA|nr:xanthine dehydrogenase family protein molybdopterin-binding subunit [Rhodococcus rhodnii]EOM74491.1 bifunctional xanthine dehydrogenase [Rhodococcus rhodnii LMG 5362]TXG92295.1 xanthine dehydrogenase family protein molybdopterin-binding subunit [Rhodococcus rhodnii]